MLQLKNIKKEYGQGDNKVHALKGVSLDFRKSEFVSILGASGCGKTTLLNIIGGLDKYTDGDLLINGVSTKNYKDRDWDSYRNHSVGFVFQSYNLIPHQTVLQNVELALTLSGVSKAERRKRAKAALEKVGLGNQLHKKQAMMSGGQIQRVAIARAIVGNPDIILADEPTGALDTETSKQVMDILKEVSKDHLVIMVTHNPELAKEYSTRIIQILDGTITSDSMPMTPEEIKFGLEKCEERRKMQASAKKPTMSPFTSFELSLKNLVTKKGRTILTSFAGSIGIIGISLILAVSQGTTNYINKVQEDTLTSYPLSIEKTTLDLSSIMEMFTNKDDEAVENAAADTVYSKASIVDMLSAMNSTESSENNLKDFKKYLDSEMANSNSKLYGAITGIQYSYDLPIKIYTKSVDDKIISSDTTTLLTKLMSKYTGVDSEAISGAATSNAVWAASSSSVSSNLSLWSEMLGGKDGELISDTLKSQYDVVYGQWPENYNEVVLVVSENNKLDDLALYAMGLLSEEDIENIVDEKEQTKSWTYQEILEREYKLVLNQDCYSYDALTDTYTNLLDSDSGIKYLYDNALSLEIVGIIRPNDDSTSSMISGSIAYTSALTDYMINAAQDSEIVKKQKENTSTDIVSGLPFKSNIDSLSTDEKAEEFDAYIDSLASFAKIEMYKKLMQTPTDAELNTLVKQVMDVTTREDAEETLITAAQEQMGLDEETAKNYFSEMSDDELLGVYEEAVKESVKQRYAESASQQLSQIPESQLEVISEAAFAELTNEEKAFYYENCMTFSDKTYEDALSELGYVDIDDPSTINVYASSFANKDVITDAVNEYNNDKDEVDQIKYTDYVGIIMSSVTTIINAITYILIAFVAISLIVSSIMIGVITLISVQERTKEIGILRSIGASKKNVSGMFNAETLIIGFMSGVIGVGVTYILCIPINIILRSVTGIKSLAAVLPWHAAVILIVISMLLTLIAGIIPSRSAAKKDPVIALRSE